MAKGVSTRLELSLAVLALARAEQELVDLEVRQAEATQRLTSLMGVVADKPLKLDENDSEALPDENAVVPESQELSAQALANRPQFRAAIARYEQRAQALRAEEAKRWPWIQLSAIPRFRHNDTSSYPNDFGLAVDVTLPVFDLNTGNIQAADASRKQEYENFVAAIAAVRRDTSLARAELESRRVALKRYRDTILPALDEQEKLLDSVFQGQQVDLATLLAAQDTIARIRREYIDMRLQYQKAWLDLARAVGALPSIIAKKRD